MSGPLQTDANPDTLATSIAAAQRLRNEGRTDDAIAAYRAILNQHPGHAEVHNGLGIALIRARRGMEAVEAFKAAVEAAPNYPEAFNNLGNALQELDRSPEAVEAFRAAIRLRPGYGKAYFNLAETLRRLERYTESEDVFRLTMQFLPTVPEVQYGLGASLHKQRRWREATGAFRTAIRLKPNYPEAHNDLGSSLQALGSYEEAEAEYNAAAALKPDYPEALSNLGDLYCERGQYRQAETVLRRALTLRTDIPETHHNLGVALSGLCRMEEARRAFAAAIALRPTFAEAHFHLGSVLLMEGRYEDGWPEYEWRRRFADRSIAARDYAAPEWRGEELDGRTIFLHSEQGLGDTIQFARYATMIAAKGGKIVLETPAALDRLGASIPGVWRTARTGTQPPPFDLHLPLMSIPGVIGTTLATVPAAIPYVHPAAEGVARWKQRLTAHSGFRVGLVWSGDPRLQDPHAREFDRRRSIALTRLAPVLDVPGVTFVSLQKGAPQAQLNDLPSERRPLDLMNDVTDMADTAALIANLDLVIAVDTSVAHLAGAMAKPTWILVRFDHDWRWLLGRDDTPWYPTARLFRQKELGEWDDVITRVAQALNSYAKTDQSATS